MKKIFGLFVVMLLLATSITIAETEEEELPDPGTTPDSPFYGLEKAFEKIQLAFTFNKVKKAERHLRIANERLAELKAMVDKGKPEFVERLTAEYNNEVNESNRIAESAKLLKEDKSKLREHIALATTKHLAVLERVREKVPAQAKVAITRAREASKKIQFDALRNLAIDNATRAAKLNLDATLRGLNRIKQKAELGEVENVEEMLQEYEELIELSKELAEKYAEAAEEFASDYNELLVKLNEIEEKVPEHVKDRIKVRKINFVENHVRVLKKLAETNPEKAAEIYSRAAEARLNRIREKAEAGETVTVQDEMENFDRFSDFGNEISQIARGIRTNTTRVDYLVQRANEKHLEVLQRVREKVPERARMVIQGVIDRSSDRIRERIDIRERRLGERLEARREGPAVTMPRREDDDDSNIGGGQIIDDGGLVVDTGDDRQIIDDGGLVVDTGDDNSTYSVNATTVTTDNANTTVTTSAVV